MTMLPRAGSAALALSGLAGVLMPDRVAAALSLGSPRTGLGGRGRTEVRAGLGASYVALGCWALLDGSPTAHRAVGAAWLGAGATRLVGLAVDRPETDATYWGSLALELVGGVVGLRASKGR